jgi:hypothetical protein
MFQLMLASILTNLKKFRQQIYEIIQYRSDACMDLLDSLCSNISANSPVKLSLNSNHRRSYNSITDVVTTFNHGGEVQDNELLNLVTQQAITEKSDRNYFLFVSDCTPAPRKHSPTLSDRSIVYSPNAILGNKPITIGHKFSVTAFLPPKDDSPPWVLPLITQRVSSSEDGEIVGAENLQSILNIISKEAPPDKLCVNVVDSGYCKPKYIHKLHNKDAKNKNLITIVRARSNRVFWTKAKQEHSIYSGKIGHKLWYGNKFDFKDEATWGEPNDFVENKVTTKKGKLCTVKIQAWDNILMRQKSGLPMNEHPFTVYRAVMTDAGGNNVFHKPLWLLCFGDRRKEITPLQAYQDYLQRYDIEHFFKFAKNRLLADKFQTSSTQHEENWWSICSLAQATLYVAREAAKKMPFPWEKYLPEIKKSDRLSSPAQTQRSFEQLTCTIGTPAKAPKPRGKPLGRSNGQKRPKRERHSVVFKGKKTEILDTG